MNLDDIQLGTASNENYPSLTLEMLEEACAKVEKLQKDIDVSFSQWIDKIFPNHKMQDGAIVEACYSELLEVNESYLLPIDAVLRLPISIPLTPEKRLSDWLLVANHPDFKEIHKKVVTYRRGFLSKKKGDKVKDEQIYNVPSSANEVDITE